MKGAYSISADKLRMLSILAAVFSAFASSNILMARSHDLRHTIAAIVLAMVAVFFLVFVSPLLWKRIQACQGFRPLKLGLSYAVMLAAHCAISTAITRWLALHNDYWGTLFIASRCFFLYYSIPMLLGGWGLSYLDIINQRPAEAEETTEELSTITHLERRGKLVMAFCGGGSFPSPWGSLREAQRNYPGLVRIRRDVSVVQSAIEKTWFDDSGCMHVRVDGMDMEVGPGYVPGLQAMIRAG